MATIVGWRFFDRTGDLARGYVVRSFYGSLVWPQPKGDEPGAWVEHGGYVRLCESGLHASPSVYAALRERQGYVLGCVEADEPEVADATKFASRRMRIVRLYERKHLVALAIYAAILYGNDADRKCIETVIRWLDDKATAEEVRAVARCGSSVAYAAASSAAASSAAATYFPAGYASSAVGYVYHAVNTDAASEFVAKFNAGALELLGLPEEEMLATWLEEAFA